MYLVIANMSKRNKFFSIGYAPLITGHLAVQLTGSTSPLSVTSPVIAVSDRTHRPLNSEASTVAMVTPAEGPSFPTAPAGKWT